MNGVLPAEPTPAVAPPTFHPNFSTKKPGDCILVAVDVENPLGFYCRLSLLSELSTLFATLPPASGADLVDGDIPLIPLHGIKSSGLALVIEAIQSLTSPKPFTAPPRLLFREDRIRDILEATLVAKMYDISVVYRILIEVIHPAILTVKRDYYLEYAIWSIEGIEEMLPHVARCTLLPGEGHITAVDRGISQMCKNHALRAWCDLLDLHHRHAVALKRFRSAVAGDHMKAPWAEDMYPHEDCEDAHDIEFGRPTEVAGRVHRRLVEAQSLEDVVRISDEGFYLECERCLDAAQDRFSEIINWTEDFAFSLVPQFTNSRLN